MPEIKRLFNASRMNRDMDDRLVQSGEYREALNINVSKSEGSDMGAVENLLGNKLIYNSGIANAEVIGSYRDTGNEKIYYFLTSNDSYNEINAGSHRILQYDQKSNKITQLLIMVTFLIQMMLVEHNLLSFSTSYAYLLHCLNY